MALNFPSNPQDGDIYSGYTWVDSENVWRKLPYTLDSSLNDVVIDTPVSGQALTYDGSYWVNATPATTVDSLTDTDIASPSAGQALTYDGINWINSTPASTLDSLTDVTVDTPVLDQTIVYNGTNWENRAVTTGFETQFLLMGA